MNTNSVPDEPPPWSAPCIGKLLLQYDLSDIQSIV